MQRLPLTETRIGEDQVRYRVTLVSDPCSAGTQLARFLQFELLRTMATDPAVTACGMSDFQTLTMRHDGEKWVAICEATTKS
jgi:hypothetical protein